MSFWETADGLFTRIEDLAHDFTWGTLNEATLEYLRTTDPNGVVAWTTMGDEKVEELCIANSGEYSVNDLLPEMPAHLNCRCYWDVLPPLGTIGD